jgi:transcriptional regulator GlxA family with amidase domain
MPGAAPRPTIAILATVETAASVVYGMYDLFRCVGRDWPLVVNGRAGDPLLDPIIVSRQAGVIVAGNGVPIHVHRRLDDCASPDVVCIPELMLAPDEQLDGRFDSEIAWVRACHDAGALVGTACSGAILLAEAGLLDGEDATTHWAFCELLQRRHPSVRVRPQQALVASGEGQRLVMAGGGSSWMDLALYLIGRLVGVEEAMQVAKLNLIDWHHMGQQPFARLARASQVADAVIGRCQAWTADNYAVDAPVAAMAQLSGLPERSLQRRFKLATGMTPLEYVHTIRLEEAKHLLETSSQPVEAVAGQVGYDDAAFFARLFRRKVNLTPAQYRRRFGGLRSALRLAYGAGREAPPGSSDSSGSSGARL